ncbi:MAG: trans-sulfuration enzyme family protein [Thermoplasmatota archaeon]
MVKVTADARPATLAVHAGIEADPATGAVVPPLHLASTFVQEAVGVHKGWEYARSSNPTRATLEAAVAQMESPDQAAFGMAFASGSAALDTLVRQLDAGDHVVCAEDAYGGTIRLLTKVTNRWGLDATFVDTQDVDAVAAAMTPKTKLVLLETPTNPLLRVTDIQAVADVAHDGGARLAVDNTFMSPALQRPMDHGADVIYHSATKYLGGHSDLVGGLLVTRDAAYAEELAFLQNAQGNILSPFDSWLMLRGLKTLHLRMQQHCTSGQLLAERLAQHPAVKEVHFPGLADHPGHAVHARQASGPGGMMSIRLASKEAAHKLVATTRVFQLAESLGAVESLIQVPAAMTHASVPPEIRERTRLDEGLVRLSVGIEDPEDLWQDLDQALNTVDA